MGFALHYLFALGIVALLLLGLNAAARVFARGRFAPAQTKTVRVLDSVPLTKQAALHVAGIADRRYLVATAGSCVALLAELPRELGDDDLEVGQAPHFVRGGFGEVDLRVRSE